MDCKISANSIQTFIERKFLILAVDGNEDNLMLMTYFLGTFTYQLITANNGKKALSLAREYLPDLILLEIVLPDIDGLDIVAELKQNEPTKRIPVIAVTGLSRQEDRERIFRSGCDAYLCKPYLLDDLANIVKNYLKKI